MKFCLETVKIPQNILKLDGTHENWIKSVHGWLTKYDVLYYYSNLGFLQIWNTLISIGLATWYFPIINLKFAWFVFKLTNPESWTYKIYWKIEIMRSRYWPHMPMYMETKASVCMANLKIK